jgi:hypothetical protein
LDTKSVSSNNLKKRRYRELDRCWDVEDSQSDTLIANFTKTEESMSTKSTKSNKRSVKLEKKLISKVCLEVDLANNQGRILP